MSHSKFVSSIPNNKLEPVFLGGGSGPTSKSSGAYVPAFLRNVQDPEKTSKPEPVKESKEFKMTEEDFPGLSGTNQLVTPQANITLYSNALKKDIEKAKLKPKTKNETGKSSVQVLAKKQRILEDHYSDDEYYYSDEY
jgi:hypothetical protein